MRFAGISAAIALQKLRPMELRLMTMLIFGEAFARFRLIFANLNPIIFLTHLPPLKSLTRHRASWAGFFMDGRNRLWSLGSSYKRLYYSSVGELICFRMS